MKKRNGLAFAVAGGLGLAIYAASAAAAASTIQHPDITPNSTANTTFDTSNLIQQNPNNGGKATVVFADRAESGWRTDYGMHNVADYVPNSVAFSRVGGYGSGASGTCATSGGNVATPSYGRCVNITSGNYTNGNVAETCGPGCSMMGGAYNSGGSYAIVLNSLYGGTTTHNENVVSHEMGHVLGIGHHDSQEWNGTYGRWYAGLDGDWGNELWNYFGCTNQTGYGNASVACTNFTTRYATGDKYDDSNDKHVPNLYEKDRINNAYGYSTTP